MSPKVTNELRQRIAALFVAKAFEARIKDLNEKRTALADDAYRTLVSEEQEKLMRKLPRDFFNWNNSVHIIFRGKSSKGGMESVYLSSIHLTHIDYSIKRFGGVNDHAEMSSEKPLPANSFPIEDPALYKRAEKLQNVADALEQEMNDAYREAYNALGAFKTILKLEQGWPEIAPFIPAEARVSVDRSLPMVAMSKLNKLLEASAT